MQTFLYTAIALTYIEIDDYKKKKKEYLIIVLIFGVSILQMIRYLFAGNISTLPTYIYGEMQTFLYTAIALTYIEIDDYEKNKKLLAYILIAYFITGLTTGLVSLSNPNTVRAITADSGSELYESFRKINVGSFTFAYEFTLLVPIAVFALKDRIVNKVLGVALLVFMGFVILETQFTTALILFAFTLIILFIPKLTDKKVVILFIMCLLFVVSGRSLLAQLLYYLANHTSNANYVSRFIYIAYLLEGKEITTSLSIHAGRRVELYTRSLTSILSHPLFGGWANADVSGHSFILDTIAYYGLIGLVAIILLYKTTFDVFIKPYKEENVYPYFLFGFLCSILLSVVDPKTYPIVMTVIYPLIGYVLQHKNIADREVS